MEVTKKDDLYIHAVLGRESSPVAALTVCGGLGMTGWREVERKSLGRMSGYRRVGSKQCSKCR